MSSPNLPDGAFFTSINGRRCTAIPREGAQQTTREAQTTTAEEPTPTPTPPRRETPTPPADPPQRDPPQQQDPPQSDPPARASPSPSPRPDPPQRDPPQAEPPRQTPADPPLPPPQESQEPTSTSSTTRASPSPVITPPSSPPQPIRTVISPPQASQIQNPLVPPTPQRPPPLAEDGRGPILMPSLTPPSPIRPPPLADEQPRPAPPSLAPPERETGAEPSTSADTAPEETPVLVPAPPAAPVLTPPTSPLAPVFPSLSDTQPSAVETSQTDQEAAPTQANPVVVDGPQSEVEGPLVGPSSTDDEASLITSAPVPIGPGNQAGEDTVTTTGRETPLITSPSPGSSSDDGGSGLSAAIIAGAVVGGVAFLTICALLFWFWRKNKKKRRSTLLTPLSTQPPSMRKERPYIFDQESVGPTPRSTKFKAALGYSLMRLRGQVGGVFSFGHRRSSSTVLSKEQSQSQYSDITGHSRNNSAMSDRGAPQAVVVTNQDRARDWWDRLKMDALFNWRLRNDRPMDPDPFASVREKQSETVNNNAQPDFLTLLGMDEKEVEREAQRRRASRRHGSTASMEHFLGGLGLNIDKNPDPFSDSNALPSEPTRPAPTNPFADSNAIPAPGFAARPGANYIEALRRSRGTSFGGLTTRPPSTQAPRSPRYDSVYRESGGSVDSFATRRNKCRSDPFDLERPDLLLSQGGSVAGHSRTSSGPKRPWPAHMRSESFQSKYSSGVGSNGWSEPGPDVGVAGRWDSDSPTSGYRPGEEPQRQGRRLSGGSQQTQGSVGKAM